MVMGRSSSLRVVTVRYWQGVGVDLAGRIGGQFREQYRTPPEPCIVGSLE